MCKPLLPPSKPALLITCEHGGNQVPSQLARFFASSGAAQALQSHRGYDPGSLQLAEYLSQRFTAPLIASETSRLIVDLNRSLDSAQLFSEFLSAADTQVRSDILQRHYHPYRQAVHEAVARAAATGPVLHISVHSFTPLFRGQKRKVDVGVLFDPSRDWESAVSATMLGQLKALGLAAFANQPYQGTDDGLTTELRRHFRGAIYAGVEIEISNRIRRLAARTQATWYQAIECSIAAAIG